MKKIIATAILLGGIAVAGPAAAQPNPGANANYGSVNLRAGFNPDPRVVSVRAGGNLNANTAARNCAGFISRAPDFKVNYTAGSYPLIISVASSADTTLVINGPNGNWHCDDDGGENGSNPSVRFNNPRSGRYDIWVGTYNRGGTQPARLHISEVSSQ